MVTYYTKTYKSKNPWSWKVEIRCLSKRGMLLPQLTINQCVSSLAFRSRLRGAWLSVIRRGAVVEKYIAARTVQTVASRFRLEHWNQHHENDLILPYVYISPPMNISGNTDIDNKRSLFYYETVGYVSTISIPLLFLWRLYFNVSDKPG